MPVDKSIRHLNDGIGARKRVFIPGYSGCISRMQETIAGTFAQTSRDSHYLVYHGCKPSMDAATLPSPDTFYSRRPNPRIKTNAANRSNFAFGDERDWGFETLNEIQFKIPTKIPPRHASILPGGPGCTKERLDGAYCAALGKVGVTGVKRLEIAIRSKIDQRTTGGSMALRKAFKFFDTDASGDIDPDEFFAAMHAFGLEFTEDQVLALFGYYDIDRDGSLSYYEFIEKVLESSFGLDSGASKPEKIMVQMMTIVDDKNDVEVKTVLRREDINLKTCKASFDKYDVNGSGEIDIRELQQLTRALGLSLDRESINNAMFELDANRNGSISFDEFWSWWQLVATRRAGGTFAAPRTGGNKSSTPSRANRNIQRPNSEQSQRSNNLINNTGLTRPGSRGSELGSIKSMLLGEDKRGSSTGVWMTQGSNKRGNSALSRPSRPVTRSSQRSVAGEDYSPPPMLNKPPKLHGLRKMQMNLPPRPHTAPTDPMAMMMATNQSPYLRVPGMPGVPHGVTTGYVL